MSLILMALACLLAEGAVVVGLSFGIGTLLHNEFRDTEPVPACIPGLDHC